MLFFLVEVRPMIYVLEASCLCSPVLHNGGFQQINKTPLWGICTP